ncbi:site-specific integrase [Nocardioidaceae bacterium SCSIO 66511]|nr:site-specific integrase [Nocardioidaceae bacterium SCSIO 66511]
MARRHFGAVRKLPSGRYQVRYRGLDGIMRPAPFTFGNKTDANTWLSDKEVEVRRGDWYDPDAGAIPLNEYAPQWIDERPGLRPRTVALYKLLYRRHLQPDLGPLGLADITYARVRTWRRDRLDDGAGPVTVAKAYRLLKAIMNTAVDDRLIRANPCRIEGGGIERSAERKPPTLVEVFAIADAIQPRYRALVLLATFGSLRWGELMGLQRPDLDVTVPRVRIERAVQELGAERIIGPTKSGAGRRSIVLPEMIGPDLAWHLRVFAEKGRDGRVFVGPKGATPLRSNFQRIWVAALDEAGVSGVHLHDLRHAGATYAARTGATIRELMERLGHSSERAALIYQHASDERDHAIAAGLNDLIEEAKKASKKKPGEGDDPPMAGARSGT